MNTRIFLLLFSLSSAAPLSAQWSKVGDIKDQFPASCCGFGDLSFKDGRLWAGRTTLFVSDDTGSTWTQLQTFIATIGQIDFFDKQTGIVATTIGVFQTTDGGLNWLSILSRPDCYSAQYCGSKENIVALSDNVGLFYSSDAGKSWNAFNAGGHPHFTLANNDGTAYVFSDGGGGRLMRTQDQGISYTETASVDGDCFYAARDSSRAIYIVNEGGHVDNDGISTIYKSTDEGQSWKELTSKDLQYYSAGISSSKCAVFVQTTRNGIERSTDGGTTWVGINGPSNAVDTRTVCAINDNVVLAIASDGSIWRTRNSGGLPLATGKSQTYQFSTPQKAIDGTPKAEINVPISVKNAIPGRGFTLVAHYDTSDYIYKGSYANNGDLIDVQAKSWPGRSLIEFRPTDITADSVVIGHSVFTIKWFEIFCDKVTFDSAFSEGSFCSPGVIGTSATTIVGNYSGCSLGVADQDEVLPTFTIHPNPSEGVFYLTSESSISTSILVTDILGKTIRTLRGDIESDRPIQFDLQHEPAGTYYVRVQYGEHTRTIPILKQ